MYSNNIKFENWVGLDCVNLGRMDRQTVGQADRQQWPLSDNYHFVTILCNDAFCPTFDHSDNREAGLRAALCSDISKISF